MQLERTKTKANAAPHLASGGTGKGAEGPELNLFYTYINSPARIYTYTYTCMVTLITV